MNRIGTLNEKPLHAALKQHYAPEGSLLEYKLGRYVVDIFHEDNIIEIQTANFSSIHKKLRALCENYSVTLVYPIAKESWILKPDAEGKKLTRRKSPKRQDFLHLFMELIRIPSLLAHPNLSIEVVLTREEQLREFDGKRGWRRKGWLISERRLVEIVDSTRLETPDDLLGLLPGTLPEQFHTSDLAKLIGHPRWFAQKVAYCLKHTGVITPIGKQGNAIIYAPAA